MPKIVKPMSAKSVNNLKKVGWHAVGGVSGLNLQIRGSKDDGSVVPRSWILRAYVGLERVPFGLGSYPQVSLAEARDLARTMSNDIKLGIDPRIKRKQIQSDFIARIAKNKTFKDCAEAYMDAKESGHTNDKHKKQWRSTLNTYAYPIIGKMLIGDITMRNVLDVLMQDIYDRKTKNRLGKFWEIRTETASRVQQRMKAVFDFSIVNEYRTSNNPATWEGFLDTQLTSPKKIKTVKNYASVPYNELGDFMRALRKNTSISSKALQFLIYSGFRSGSVRSARWADIDFENKAWNIPAADTKMKVEHSVPLSNAAIAFLADLKNIQSKEEISTQYLFPSPRNKMLSDMALSELMRGMRQRGELKTDAVPHGFRSTFRTWLAEKTDYPDEIRKAANGHKVSDLIKKSYERTTFFDKRRQLMEDWSNFLNSKSVKEYDAKRKRIPKEPLLLDEFYSGIEKIQIILIDEETESYGSGANKKLSYFKNFDLAIQKIVTKYLDGDQKIKNKLKLTLKNPKKLKPLMEQLELIGVNLNERALRNLAKRVRTEIKAWENAIKNNPSVGTF